jgi:DNA-binding NtrC family response regulator
MKELLTFPDPRSMATSIRATALVFEDPVSATLLARIRMVAPSEASVLVIGETGTGKELIARHVHELSHRANGPFVAVNCGAFSESLVESELFGHEKGAFTGALAQKVGWFEAANGGTLFLDEIGDLPLSMQVKLLRVLQEREIVRLGSRRPTAIDVRVIAATNVKLEEAVAAGKFREDLFYRLRVATLVLPPLRARRGDILPLARHFAAEYQRRLGYARAALTPAAEARLEAHDWPGNIRELENVIHHALLVCRNNCIDPNDLNIASMPSPLGTTGQAAQDAGIAPQQALENALIALFEQHHPADLYERIDAIVMRTAYRFCDRNQLRTSRMLDMSRNIVRARLLKIGELAGSKLEAPHASAAASVARWTGDAPFAAVTGGGTGTAGRQPFTPEPYTDERETHARNGHEPGGAGKEHETHAGGEREHRPGTRAPAGKDGGSAPAAAHHHYRSAFII